MTCERSVITITFNWHRSQVFSFDNYVDDTSTEIGLMLLQLSEWWRTTRGRALPLRRPLPATSAPVAPSPRTKTPTPARCPGVARPFSVGSGGHDGGVGVGMDPPLACAERALPSRPLWLFSALPLLRKPSFRNDPRHYPALMIGRRKIPARPTASCFASPSVPCSFSSSPDDALFAVPQMLLPSSLVSVAVGLALAPCRPLVKT